MFPNLLTYGPSAEHKCSTANHLRLRWQYILILHILLHFQTHLRIVSVQWDAQPRTLFAKVNWGAGRVRTPENNGADRLSRQLTIVFVSASHKFLLLKFSLNSIHYYGISLFPAGCPLGRDHLVGI